MNYLKKGRTGRELWVRRTRKHRYSLKEKVSKSNRRVITRTRFQDEKKLPRGRTFYLAQKGGQIERDFTH